MFEKLIIWALKKLIAIALPQWHLSKNPVRKQKVKEEEVTNNV